MPATLSVETIRRRLDETECDHCGYPLFTGDRVVYDLAAGAAYCCTRCARLDTAEDDEQLANARALPRN